MVFIDFHGTLCHDLFWRSLPPDKRNRLAQFLFDQNLPLVSRWMRGEVTSEQINALLAQVVDLPCATLWETFVADCMSMSVSSGALASIDRLRSETVVLLVTDNMDCFTRFTVPALGLRRHFDAIVNSSDTHRLKADGNGAVFHDLAAARHIGIKDCTLLDDSADACANMTAMGGTALRICVETPVEAALEGLLRRP